MTLLAFTGLALAGAASAYIVAAAAVADAAIVAASAYAAYSAAQQQKKQAKAEARVQRMQAEAYGLQSADAQRKANEENVKAGIAQMQGEQEAERRSRAMAADIGSVYANYAANGLLVDSSMKGDTLGGVLTTTVGEAQSDISTMRDNARMSVWERQSDAKSLMVDSRTAKISQQTSLIGSAMSRKNARYYNRASYLGAASAGISSASSAISSGFSGKAYAERHGA